MISIYVVYIKLRFKIKYIYIITFIFKYLREFHLMSESDDYNLCSLEFLKL